MATKSSIRHQHKGWHGYSVRSTQGWDYQHVSRLADAQAIAAEIEAHPRGQKTIIVEVCQQCGADYGLYACHPELIGCAVH